MKAKALPSTLGMRRKTLIDRLASAGLVAALLMLAGFSAFSAWSSYRVAQASQQANEVGRLYGKAHYDNLRQETIEWRYQAQPSAKLKQEAVAVSNKLIADLERLLVVLPDTKEYGHDHGHVQQMLAKERTYAAAVQRMFNALDRGDRALATEIKRRNVDPVHKEAGTMIDHHNELHGGRQEASYQAVLSRSRLVLVVTPLLFLTALLFVAGMFYWARRRHREFEGDLSSRNEELTHTLEALNRREAELVQAQKMEAVGQLAGGVAHDFNNMLMAIQGSAEMLSLDLEGESLEMAQDIIQVSERAALLTSQLLAFSRKQVLQKRVFDLGATLEQNLSMVGRLVGSGIEIEVSDKAKDTLVYADPAQVAQVVVNLCVNARDAMNGTGSVRIVTDDFRSEGQSALGLPLPAGDYVSCSVSDDGGGIPLDKQRSIFEPFFTTKEVGKGTGLGLSMVLGIIEQSGGTIDLTSSPGEGATFTFYLPAAVAPTSTPGVGPDVAPTDAAGVVDVVDVVNVALPTAV